MDLRAVALACVLPMAALAGAAVGERDLHAYWHDRCLSCHGDAGAFARRTLSVVDGQLAGRHHRGDLPRFLSHHYLSSELVEPVTAMLAAQATTAPVFKERCGTCHGSAADFARQSLAMKDGVLTGRRTGKAVADYLRGHGPLSPDEVPAVVRALERVRAEVGTASP